MTLSRRRVLAALAAAGSAGALTGSGAGALLRDAESGSFDLTTGIVDVVVDYWRDVDGHVNLTSPDGVADGPRLDVPLGPLSADTSGNTLLRFRLPQDEGINNPASLWLRTDCPSPSTLAELLDVRVSYSDASGTPGAPLASGNLREVADALRTGIRLDGDPTTPEFDCLTDDVFVLVEYDLGAYVGSETTSLGLSVAAVQCRNADPGANPFPADAVDEPCDPAYACNCCWAIGKVEVDDRLRSGTTYAFDEGLTDYAIRVTDTDGDSGVAFELVGTGGAPVLPLCAVDVKGGTQSVTYSRQHGEFGFETGVLDGASDGLVYAPENPNNGKRYAISHVLVRVCAPTLADGECPPDATQSSNSGGGDGKSGGSSSDRGGRGGGRK